MSPRDLPDSRNQSTTLAGPEDELSEEGIHHGGMRVGQDSATWTTAGQSLTPTDGEPESGVWSPENGIRTAWRDRLVMETLRLLLRHRLLCLFLAVCAAAAGGIATIFISPFYIAHASIFPPATDNPLVGLGVSGVAGLFGNLNLGEGGASLFPLYERFLFSRTLVLELLDSTVQDSSYSGTLLEYLNLDEPDDSLRKEIGIDLVRGRLSFETDKKTAVVTIGFRDGNPRIAAQVVNQAVSILDRMDAGTAAERAAQRRQFIESRLTEAGTRLTTAEKRLEDFREQNLRIGNAPELLLEQGRLQRELEIEQEVYLTLRKEFELARIEEQRSVPVLNILDKATPPLVPAGPSLVRNSLLAGFLGTVVVVAVFAARAIGLDRSLTRFRSLGPARRLS